MDHQSVGRGSNSSLPNLNNKMKMMITILTIKSKNSLNNRMWLQLNQMRLRPPSNRMERQNSIKIATVLMNSSATIIKLRQIKEAIRRQLSTRTSKTELTAVTRMKMQAMRSSTKMT